MGYNDLTSPVLQMRKYQTRKLQILVVRVGLLVLYVLLLRARALLLAASLFWGVTLNHVSCVPVLTRPSSRIRAGTLMEGRVTSARTGSGRSR